MVRLDLKYLRYMPAEEFRTLTGVEMGMRNHELVPVQLIASIASVKADRVSSILRGLVEKKLVVRENKHYEGFRLTYLGYDYLALKTMTKRGTIASVGNQIGVGKESDVYVCADQDGNQMILKLHRLGRTSFRNIKKSRDYLKGRHTTTWIYLSRLAAMKEYAYMKALYDRGFPVPIPHDFSRHAIVMEYVTGHPMCQVSEIANPGEVYDKLICMLLDLAKVGLIHCDFNEFNIILKDDGTPVMIDFPQMVSTSHRNAKMYFDRDAGCIRDWFERKYDFVAESVPSFTADVAREGYLDQEINASGYDAKMEGDLQRFLDGQRAEEEEQDVEDQHELDKFRGDPDSELEDDHDIEDDRQEDQDVGEEAKIQAVIEEPERATAAAREPDDKLAAVLDELELENGDTRVGSDNEGMEKSSDTLEPYFDLDKRLAEPTNREHRVHGDNHALYGSVANDESTTSTQRQRNPSLASTATHLSSIRTRTAEEVKEISRRNVARQHAREQLKKAMKQKNKGRKHAGHAAKLDPDWD
eukprot:Clim_evm24s154 gene=Clim_evmTU24s154